MRSNRSEQKQEERTVGSIQHNQLTLASLLLLVTCKCNTASKHEAWDGNCSNTLRRLDAECSSPNSQRSARCHLSEMDLTRQRLVTFLREGMRAAVLQGVEAPGQKREDWRSVVSQRCFEYLQIK